MRAIYQFEHERINAKEYPGTRQLCVFCEEPTERCEDDAIYTEEGKGPLCEECYKGELERLETEKGTNE
jgi:hypothetical protein